MLMTIDELELAFARLDVEQRSVPWQRRMAVFLNRASRLGRHDLVRACLMTLARYEEQVGDYRQALARRRRLLTYDPDNALVWYEVGRLQHRLGRRDQAMAAFERVLVDDAAPTEVRGWAKRAIGHCTGTGNTTGPMSSIA